MVSIQHPEALVRFDWRYWIIPYTSFFQIPYSSIIFSLYQSKSRFFNTNFTITSTRSSLYFNTLFNALFNIHFNTLVPYTTIGYSSSGAPFCYFIDAISLYIPIYTPFYNITIHTIFSQFCISLMSYWFCPYTIPLKPSSWFTWFLSCLIDLYLDVRV